MGSLYSKLCAELCSKSSTHEGGHTILNHNTVGGEVDGSNPSNPRAAAAEAAERRAKVAQARGSQGGKGGKLAQKLAARSEPAELPERLVWD